MNKGNGHKLVREIGLWDATAICIGCIIGSGIFRVPSTIAAQLPSASLILLVWILGGLISLAGALCYAELAAAFPKTGGDYVFVTEAYGPAWGFVFGWTKLFIERTGTLAAISIVFSEYTIYFLQIPHAWMKPIAIATIAVLTGANVLGVKWGKGIQNIFTLLKMLALAGIIVIGLLFRKGNIQNFASLVPPSLSLNMWQAMGVGLIAVLFTYGGWIESSYVAGEMKKPQRDLPLSIVVGLLITTVFYLLVNAIYLYYVPVSELKNAPLAAASMMEKAIGSAGGKIVALMVLTSTFGALNGYILTGSRMLYAMAQDHALFRQISQIHPRFHSPWIALWVNAAVAVLLVLSGTFDQLLSFMTVVVWFFFIFVGGSVFILRKKFPHIPRPYRIWGYPWVPLIFIGSTSLFVINALIKDPQHALLGFVVASLGFPLYALSSNLNKRSKLPSIPQ